MATVTMNLEEYNELRDKAQFYESIVNTLTTPYVSEYRLSQFIQDKEKSPMMLFNNLEEILSPTMLYTIEECIKKNIPEELQSLGTFNLKGSYISLGSIEHLPEIEEFD